MLSGLSSAPTDPVHFAYPSTEAVATSTPAWPYLGFDQRRYSREDQTRLIEYIRRHQIDFVFLFDSQATRPLYRVLRSAGVRRIVAYWGAQISSENRGLRLLAKKVQFRLSPSKIDGLIFESKAMARLATHGRGVPANRTRVVPLGVDTERFSPSVSDYAHEAFSIPRDQALVVYSGHMEARKGVATLVQAAIRLLRDRGRRDVTFLLFGNKNGDEEPHRLLFQGLDVEEHIRFGGYRTDLPSILPSCDIGVVPSSGWDSFPRSAIEMGACGLPLIVSDLGGLPETIVPGHTGLLFMPGNCEQLAHQLEVLLNDREYARRLGASGRLRCSEQFSLAAQGRNLQEAVKHFI